MFKGTVKHFLFCLLFITSAIGVFSIISGGYCTWYNWKYEHYNVKAIPGYFGAFKYVPKSGYHLEALCQRAGVQVRLPKVEGFDYLSMVVDGKLVNKRNCEILIVKDLNIIPPLSDYHITPKESERTE